MRKDFASEDLSVSVCFSAVEARSASAASFASLSFVCFRRWTVASSSWSWISILISSRIARRSSSTIAHLANRETDFGKGDRLPQSSAQNKSHAPNTRTGAPGPAPSVVAALPCRTAIPASRTSRSSPAALPPPHRRGPADPLDPLPAISTRTGIREMLGQERHGDVRSEVPEAVRPQDRAVERPVGLNAGLGKFNGSSAVIAGPSRTAASRPPGARRPERRYRGRENSR